MNCVSIEGHAKKQDKDCRERERERKKKNKQRLLLVFGLFDAGV